MVHNFYQQPGGEDQSFAAEAEVLRQHGEDVVIWTVQNDEISTRPSARLAVETVWNRRAAMELRRRLVDEGPFDIVHFQNTFPLISPAAIWAAGTSTAAVVQSLRNYRLLCVNGLFYRAGGVCELCIDKRLQLPGIRYACYRGNTAASMTVAAMNYVNRARRTHQRAVDVFIALSNFARAKYAHAELDIDRIVVKPNFVTPDPGFGHGAGGYAIFVGRLSPEKGIETMLKAWAHIGKRLPLRIVGDGPQAELVKAVAEKSKGAVTWLGHKNKFEVYELIGDAKCLVFPSEWYETFGRVAVEAFAKGTPVIAADLGAIAELVEDGKTGVRFEPANADDLVAKIRDFLDHPDHPGWRRRVRAEYEQKYSAERNYEALMRIYERAVARKRGT
jgi:glycosyltransferase involved in cell wall biosynthesis